MSVWDWVFILPTWLNTVIVIAVLLYVYGVWPYKTTNLKYPGPPPTAFIGNLRQLFSLGVHEADSENIKKYGKLTVSWAAREPQLLVGDPDMVKEINIKQFPNFVNRMVLKGKFSFNKIEKEQITILEDDHWKFVRATLSPAFSSGRLREMVPVLHTCLDNLLDVISDRAKQSKSCDFKEVFQAFTLDAISATAFGIDSCVLKNPSDEFAALLKKVFARGPSPLLFVNLFFPFVARIMQYFDISVSPKETMQVMDTIIRDVKNNMEQRKINKTTRRDLLQLMIDARVDEADTSEDNVDVHVLDNNIQNHRKGLTENEIMAQSFIFLVAGYATTAGTLGFLAYNLALNPECQDKLIEEIDKDVGKAKPDYDNVMKLPYLDMCFSETMRIFPAANRTARVAKDDIVIKGHLIPKGLSIQFPIPYLHHNPEYWPEPEKFKPERFTPEEKAKRHPYVYMPFGVGPRNCVGMRLAQLEAKMAMVTVLQKFRFVRSIDTEVPLKLATMGLTEAKNGIWLKVEPRSDS